MGIFCGRQTANSPNEWVAIEDFLEGRHEPFRLRAANALAAASEIGVTSRAFTLSSCYSVVICTLKRRKESMTGRGQLRSRRSVRVRRARAPSLPSHLRAHEGTFAGAFRGRRRGRLPAIVAFHHSSAQHGAQGAGAQVPPRMASDGGVRRGRRDPRPSAAAVPGARHARLLDSASLCADSARLPGRARVGRGPARGGGEQPAPDARRVRRGFPASLGRGHPHEGPVRATGQRRRCHAQRPSGGGCLRRDPRACSSPPSCAARRPDRHSRVQVAVINNRVYVKRFHAESATRNQAVLASLYEAVSTAPE